MQAARDESSAQCGAYGGVSTADEQACAAQAATADDLAAARAELDGLRASLRSRRRLRRDGWSAAVRWAQLLRWSSVVAFLNSSSIARSCASSEAIMLGLL